MKTEKPLPRELSTKLAPGSRADAKSTSSRRQFPASSQNTRSRAKTQRAPVYEAIPEPIAEPEEAAYQPPPIAPSVTTLKPARSKKSLVTFLILLFITILIALIRFDLRPVTYIGGAGLIMASILSMLGLVGFVLFFIFRWILRRLRSGYRFFVMFFPLAFTTFIALYLFLNIIAQVFDPVIDRVLNDLPPPELGTTFAKHGNSYQQVVLPVDRRVCADEISESVVRPTIIDVEDERIETRFGPIDTESLLRGAVITFVVRRRREGGSTILIQAAKNILKWKSRSDSVQVAAASGNKVAGRESLSRALARKAAELLLSLRLAQRFPTVDEQLALYLSVSPMGGSGRDSRNHTFAYAAQDLFGVTDFRTLKKGDTQSVLITAMLVGMLKAPTSYHPRLYPDEALKRRNVALSQMAKRGDITQDLQTLQAQPIQLRELQQARNLKFYYNAARGVSGP